MTQGLDFPSLPSFPWLGCAAQSRVRGVTRLWIGTVLRKDEAVFHGFNSSIRQRAKSLCCNFVFCQCAKSVNVFNGCAGVVL